MIELNLPILPLPWKAPYVGSHGAFSPRYNEAKIIKAMIREQYTGSLILGQLNVFMDFYFPIPKAASKKKREKMLSGEIRPQAYGDRVNLVKFYEDLMQGIVYKNDRQIVGGAEDKWYDEKPSVTIHVLELI